MSEPIREQPMRCPVCNSRLVRRLGTEHAPGTGDGAGNISRQPRDDKLVCGNPACDRFGLAPDDPLL